MVDEGIRLSDEHTKQLMKRLDSVYDKAYKTALANNKKAIEKLASLTDEKLKSLTPEQRKLKRTAFANEVKRTQGLANNIAKEIATAGKTAAEITQMEMINIYGLNYDFSAYDISKQANLNLSFTRYDKRQIDVLIQENQSPFTKIAYKNLGADKVITSRLQNAFIVGTMNGESQQKLIQRIKGITGQSTKQAKRVAQTERNRIQSQGRNQAIHEASEMGIKMSKQWFARLRNTRELHLRTHLEVVKDGETFSNDLEYPGDPNGSAANVCNCFCIIIPRVQSASTALAKLHDRFDKQSFERYREQTGRRDKQAKD